MFIMKRQIICYIVSVLFISYAVLGLPTPILSPKQLEVIQDAFFENGKTKLTFADGTFAGTYFKDKDQDRIFKISDKGQVAQGNRGQVLPVVDISTGEAFLLKKKPDEIDAYGPQGIGPNEVLFNRKHNLLEGVVDKDTFIMRRVKGETLRKHMPISIKEILEQYHKAYAMVQDLHRTYDHMHHDLHPGNIIVQEDDADDGEMGMQVIDFGNSQPLGEILTDHVIPHLSREHPEWTPETCHARALVLADAYDFRFLNQYFAELLQKLDAHPSQEVIVAKNQMERDSMDAKSFERIVWPNSELANPSPTQFNLSQKAFLMA